MESSPYDAVDRTILYHLQQNARKPITDIADAVNVTDNTVRNRIENLEEDGVIEGYQVDVNYDKVGVPHHYKFTCSARVSEREELASEARQHAGVTEVITLMTGKDNVCIIGAATEKDEMSNLAYDLDGLGLDIERESLIRRHSRDAFDGFRMEENV